jgi:hypothetical protein
MALEKEYLTFEELTKCWNLSSDDLHYLIGKGELIPSIIWDGSLLQAFWIDGEDGKIIQPIRDVDLIYIREWIYLKLPFLTGDNKYSFGWASTALIPPKNNDSDNWNVWYMLAGKGGAAGTGQKRIDQDYVQQNAVFMTSAIEMIEPIWCPKLLELSITPTLPIIDNAIMPNKNLPTYPPELAIAIEAWQAVSANDTKFKPKARIKKWLDDNYPRLSNEAKERIATVANWDKTGGATST